MVGLMTSRQSYHSLLKSPTSNGRRILKKAGKAVMRSYRFKLPKYNLPIRLRPWFILFTSLTMMLLAFLGFTNFARSLPLNDKLLHLIFLCLATGIFYFIFDVEEDARRVWLWRHASLLITGVICFFLGGLYKEFQIGDVVANLLGSAIGLGIAYNLERYYRHRREISRLYRPISLDPDLPESEDEDDAPEAVSLPIYHSRRPLTPSTPGGAFSPKTASKDGQIRLGNVWDEREELFGIGDSDEEEPAPRAVGPKIVITSS